MEVTYKVRILYLSTRRERQKVSMRDYKIAPPVETDAKPAAKEDASQVKLSNKPGFTPSKKKAN
jgi:hypothetical protein